MDAHHNAGSASFVVNVVDRTTPTLTDTTPPAVTVPGTMTVEATGPGGAAVTYTAAAADLVDGAMTPSCSIPSGATFALGSTTVTCTATDAHHNAGSASFAVNVVDRTPPTLSVPAPLVVDAASSRGAVVTYTVTATDSVSGQSTAVCSKASRTVFPIGNTTVSCTATDARGNAAPARTFAVHVKGAREQLGDVLRQVISWKLRSHALQNRVSQVIRTLTKSPSRSCRPLGDLEKALRGPLGKGLTTARRSTLRGELGRIANVVGCTSKTR